MAEPRCAHCGSRRVQALANAVGCEVCGSATDYDGELVHGPSIPSADPPGVGGSGALPPSASQNPGQSGMTTTETVDEEAEEPADGDLDTLSKEQLYEIAQEQDIPGRSSMTKDELVEALRG